MALHNMTIGPMVDAIIVDDAVDDFFRVDTAGDDEVFLSSGGAGGFNPTSIGSSSSIVSPTGTWIDNELTRFSGASGGATVIQGANIVVDDSNNMTLVNDITMTGDLDTNGIKTKTRSKSTTYIATASDNSIFCNASGGAFTITLPAASGNGGLILNIKKIDSSVNAVTIDANASETIDGALTAVITTQYESVTIQCDGTEWWII